MKIAIIYDATPGAQKDPEVNLALGILKDVQDIARILENQGFEVEIVGFHFPVLWPVSSLLKAKVDLIFNLCEGLGEDSTAEIYVASLIEALGLPFTGTDAMGLALCHNKDIAKGIMAYHGIPTPKHILIDVGNKIRRNGLEFPLIVKPVHEDGSFGIDADSVVTKDQDLRKKVSWIHKTFHQAAIVEEFIDGREFNVSILGNDPFEFVQVREIQFEESYQPRIVSFKSKWKRSSTAYHATKSCEAGPLSEDIHTEIAKYAIQCFRHFKMRDYARIDFRLGKSCVPYVIDINPNPCISRDSGMVMAAVQNGYTYESLIGKIAKFALSRLKSLEGAKTGAL